MLWLYKTTFFLKPMSKEHTKKQNLYLCYSRREKSKSALVTLEGHTTLQGTLHTTRANKQINTVIGAIKKTNRKLPCLAFILHNIPWEIFLNYISVNLLSLLFNVEFYLHFRIYFSAKNYTALHQQ